MTDKEKIRDILLQHKGKANPVTSKTISAEFGYPMEDTQVLSRKTIHNVAEEYHLPLLSCNKGYYIAETEQELEEYNKNIDSRINNMDKRRNLINEYFRRENR